MTIEIKTVGKTIRDLIEKQRTPEAPQMKAYLSTVAKIKTVQQKAKPVPIYTTSEGVILNIGEGYKGYTIHNIIICTYSRNDGKQYGTMGGTKVGDYLPVHEHKIIRSNRTLTTRDWNKFKNKYKFELAGKEKKLTDKVMSTLIYNTDKENKLMRASHKRLDIRFYKGVILETVKHIKNAKNMTVIEDQENVVTALNTNKYWFVFNDIETNLGIYYTNRTLNIVTWKYDDQWIITSSSSFSRVNKYLNEK